MKKLTVNLCDQFAHKRTKTSAHGGLLHYAVYFRCTEEMLDPANHSEHRSLLDA